MDAEKAAKILGITGGAFAIIAAFLWWWWVISPTALYGMSSIDVFIWMTNNSWPVLLDPFNDIRYLIYYICMLVLIVGGIVFIIASAKVNKKAGVTGLIIIVIGSILAITYMVVHFIIANFSFERFFFYIIGDAFVGLGPGFYLAITSIILCICGVIAIYKSK
ncbi:MAG: hypothetical protein EAX96_19445 [Candidatus Lokiarchaeota archaeon]|nr:hypothetical protein [Candidatus Lokiarchaeota archaeon]